MCVRVSCFFLFFGVLSGRDHIYAGGVLKLGRAGAGGMCLFVSNLTRLNQHMRGAHCQGAIGGDSFSCREYHLGAAKSNAAVHCPHASKLGADVCVDPAADRQSAFCTTYASTCATDGKPYSDCAKQVKAMPLGTTRPDGLANQDTFACRE